MKDPIVQFRLVAVAEGISYVLLLVVAMPLKYVYGYPGAVRVVGAVHGGLFLLYVVAAVRAARYGRWSFERILEAVAASVFPLGPFLLERKLKRESSGGAPPADSREPDRTAREE